MASILIAEDEKSISELILRNLRLVGHSAAQAFNGAAALQMAESQSFDLILLDVMLPLMSGFDVKQALPQEQPVIFVTAKGDLSSRLAGLGYGADDYITKPFEILELLARVEAVLRRIHKNITQLTIGAASIDISARRAYVDGAEAVLTPQEFSLLEVMLCNRNLALSREKLLELAWGYDYEGDTRTVDVHIQRLRKKLCLEAEIETVYKLGYRLNSKG